jgi:hypothetical protein
MTVTQQGNHLALSDTESVSAWVNRTSPAVSAVESNAAPASAVSAPVTPATAPATVPSSPVSPAAPQAPQTPNTPSDTAPAAPAESPATAPTSDVRWLLPSGDLQATWSPAGASADEGKPAFWGGLTSGLMGAVSKMGQWVGLDLGRAAKAPGPDTNDSASSTGQDAGERDNG